MATKPPSELVRRAVRDLRIHYGWKPAEIAHALRLNLATVYRKLNESEMAAELVRGLDDHPG